jgi:hypothetical protein
MAHLPSFPLLCCLRPERIFPSIQCRSFPSYHIQVSSTGRKHCCWCDRVSKEVWATYTYIVSSLISVHSLINPLTFELYRICMITKLDDDPLALSVPMSLYDHTSWPILHDPPHDLALSLSLYDHYMHGPPHDMTHDMAPTRSYDHHGPLSD